MTTEPAGGVQPGSSRAPSLATASLDATELRVIDRLLALLERELGDDLRAVWLFGSRARGERPQPESDVDLLVVARGGRERYQRRVIELTDEAADAEGASPVFFEALVWAPAYVEDRRRIRSFFMQEVDRDRIVLFERS